MCTSNIAPTLFLYMRLQCTWNAFNGCVNVEGKYRSCHYACQAPLLNVYRICENARVRREFCLIYIHERIWFSQFVSVMHLLVFNYTNLDCIYSWPRPIRSVSRRQFLSSFFSDVLCGNGICTCALFRSCWLHRGGTGPLRVMGQVHFGSRVAARQLDIQTRRHALQQLYCTHNVSGHNAFDSVARMRTVFVRDVDGPIIYIYDGAGQPEPNWMLFCVCAITWTRWRFECLRRIHIQNILWPFRFDAGCTDECALWYGNWFFDIHALEWSRSSTCTNLILSGHIDCIGWLCTAGYLNAVLWMLDDSSVQMEYGSCKVPERRVLFFNSRLRWVMWPFEWKQNSLE